jgi:2-iminobutanoate/2-iminopropanoate deaminase
MEEKVPVWGEDLPRPQGPYSPAMVRGDLVFVSGLVAVRPNGSRVAGDVREEALVVLRNLKNVLEEAGSSLDQVLQVTVYLRDMDDLPAFNEVYEEFFSPPYPARSVAGVEVPGGFLLEVSAVAYRG